MSTSGIDRQVRTCVVYGIAAAACALFGAVYEAFSHGVWSYFMVYAFAWPLVLGMLPFGVMALRKRAMPGRLVLNLWHSGVAALTVGCVMEGVLEIYGTTNQLTAVYWIVGAGMLAAGGLRGMHAPD